MEKYYFLKDNDVIKEGDEWTTNEHVCWYPCLQSIDWINIHWATEKDVCSGWKVRRLIKCTKLGNTL